MEKQLPAYVALKQLRISKKISQKELAAKVGITQQAIALIENGKRKLEFDLFVQLLTAMEVSKEELLDIIHNTIIDNIKSIETSIEFDSNEEAEAYIELLGNINNLNEKGLIELSHYSSYLLSKDEYYKTTASNEILKK